MNAAAFFLLLALYPPSPVLPGFPEGSGAPQDRLLLRNGYMLEGRILKRDGETFRIELGPGQVVEIEAARVRKVLEGPRPSPGGGREGQDSEGDGGRIRGRKGGAEPRPTRKAPRDEGRGSLPADRGDEEGKGGAAIADWKVRDAWFRLRDETGKVLGTLFLCAQAGEAGGFHLEERWNFYEGGERTVVQRIEDLDPRGRTKSFLYRENVLRRGTTRSLGERLVRGRIEGERLFLDEVGPKGRVRRTLPFLRGNRLPLSFREEARQEGFEEGIRECPVYDPLEGVSELRSLGVRKRDPVARGLFREGEREAGRARRLEFRSPDRVRREWISAEGRVLLIEVNGVHLVAERIPSELGRRLVEPERMKAGPSVRSWAGFECRLPRATWSFAPGGRGPVLVLRPPVEGARVRWVLQPLADRRQLLPGAVEDGLRRFLLDHPGFEEKKRGSFQEGGEAWTEVLLESRRGGVARLFFRSFGASVVRLEILAEAGGMRDLSPVLSDLRAGLRRPFPQAARPGR